MARRRQTSGRRYPRTARLNELVREIVAEELERIDDERLGFFTVTAVEVDPGLEHAKIHWSDIGVDDATVLEVLEEHRGRLQRAVNAQTHLRRTPVLSFHADQVARSASRIEEILHDLQVDGTSGSEGEQTDEGVEPDDPTQPDPTPPGPSGTDASDHHEPERD